MAFYGKIFSMLNTASGTRVTKYLQEGNKVLKEIKYAPTSRMAKMGIGGVNITKAGKEGKRIYVNKRDGECFMVGTTKPQSKFERPILDQLREYVDAAKFMLYNDIKLG